MKVLNQNKDKLIECKELRIDFYKVGLNDESSCYLDLLEQGVLVEPPTNYEIDYLPCIKNENDEILGKYENLQQAKKILAEALHISSIEL